MNANLMLILGSSSTFRQQQLKTLGLSFQVAQPDFDETPQINEMPYETALRLAVGNAHSLVTQYPQHLIIGADQVAWCNSRQLGKPMSELKAQQMLAELSGQRIKFYSAVCLLNTLSGSLHTHVDTTIVTMRPLTDVQISQYLKREPDAIYCAGAAKSEGLGSALLSNIESSDPNALIGLPIFKLIDFLSAEGINVL